MPESLACIAGVRLKLLPLTPEPEPLAEPSPWYVLLEVSLYGEARADDAAANTAIEGLLEAALENELATDAAVSTSLAQFRALWALREDISESQGAEGKTIKHDIALPISRIAEFIESTDAAIAQAFTGVRMVVFGHLGDGNLHFNMSRPEGWDNSAWEAETDAVNLIVHDTVARHAGSISAEHGIGQLKRHEVASYKSALEIDVMQRIKRALDPAGLMNPGKLLPD